MKWLSLNRDIRYWFSGSTYNEVVRESDIRMKAFDLISLETSNSSYPYQWVDQRTPGFSFVKDPEVVYENRSL